VPVTAFDLVFKWPPDQPLLANIIVFM